MNNQLKVYKAQDGYTAIKGDKIYYCGLNWKNFKFLFTSQDYAPPGYLVSGLQNLKLFIFLNNKIKDHENQYF